VLKFVFVKVIEKLLVVVVLGPEGTKFDADWLGLRGSARRRYCCQRWSALTGGDL
jgi:hypothetical protein